MFAEFLLKPFSQGNKIHLATCILVVVTVGLLCRWLKKGPTKLNLPPGPWLSVPYLGYLPFLGTDFTAGFEKLRKKYGPVYRLRLGERDVVVLSDFPSVKEALNKSAFLDRPPNPPNNLIKDSTSLTVNNGIIWREQRRFALHVMRNLGYGKKRMEYHIKEEVDHLVNELEEFKGKPTEVRRYLAPSVSNNISALVFGRRMDYHDPKRITLDHLITEVVRFFRPTCIHAWFPWLKELLIYFKLLDYNKLKSAATELMDFIEHEIDGHQATLDPNNIRDYIDGFLFRMKERTCKEPNTSFTRPMLKGNVLSLISAGSTTVKATIEWTLLTMAQYQNVQKRIQDEIEEIIGRERTPMYADHTQMPYTNAVLMEVQRWKTVVPINLLRHTTEDSSVLGYDIPKGVTVIVNIRAVHKDPNVFEDPFSFKPERFLSLDGKEVTKHESWIPFTIGKRMCPGESLANVEVFLYVTTMLQKFHITFPEGKLHNFEGDLGGTFEPKYYELCMNPRC